DVLPTGALPGGAPLNVAYHLQKLGVNAVMISRIGRDERGEQLKEILQQNKLPLEFIQADDYHETGVVNATFRPNNEVLYDIVFPVAWDFIEWNPSLQTLVEESSVFVYGSLSARNETSRKTLFKLREAATKRVVDINLRPPHFNAELIDDLLQNADVVKLNDHELDFITQPHHSNSVIEDKIRFLQDKYAIPVVIVTRGGSGAILCNEGELFNHGGFKVTVCDTVGSGDAFLAAFIYKSLQGAQPNEQLQYANAVGAFIASKQGACPEYGQEQIEEWIKGVMVP
ncbi:MAG TPA: carbohydrate kinase, partial [Flavisolibacter sp.]|nr:carbohydrate kinase [Flavisolibacter sp.]